MSKQTRVIVTLTDDLDGTELPEGEGHTVVYTWQGVEYEIDLSDAHAAQFAALMQPMVDASRRIGGLRKPSRAKSAVAAAAQTQAATTTQQAATTQSTNGNGNGNSWRSDRHRRDVLAEVRSWARENGFPTQPDRGRLISGVREAWNATHPEQQVPDEATPREMVNA